MCDISPVLTYRTTWAAFYKLTRVLRNKLEAIFAFPKCLGIIALAPRNTALGESTMGLGQNIIIALSYSRLPYSEAVTMVMAQVTLTVLCEF